MGRQPAGRSAKPVVIQELARRYDAGELPDGIVTNDDIVEAMDAVDSTLSRQNPANFLKDLLRGDANAKWPAELTARGIFPRQMYGDRRVFQFYQVEIGENPLIIVNDIPDDAPIHTVSSLRIDSLARNLGRTEETWLSQVVVSLDLIGHQLSVYSPDNERARIINLRFLQVGMKTQPEIDAVFVAEYQNGDDIENVFITVEFKQIREQILPNQIREQVRKAFEVTANIDDCEISAVKPMAVNVVSRTIDGEEIHLICVREYTTISRVDFDVNYSRQVNPLAVYEVPLNLASCALYRPMPPLRAV